MLNAACDHVHDDCDCDDCAHDDCDCEDHCGESHSCSCDNYEDIGLDGSPEGGVSFSLDYYELGNTSNPMKISIVIYGDNSYSGSVKYSDITAAAYVSKGTSFNMANSVSLDNVQIKSVTAKKTTPAVRSGKIVIPKALAEKADGTYPGGVTKTVTIKVSIGKK